MWLECIPDTVPTSSVGAYSIRAPKLRSSSPPASSQTSRRLIHPTSGKWNSRKFLGQKPMASSKIYGILKKALLLSGAKRPRWKVGERRQPNDQRSHRPQREQQPRQDDAHARGGSREPLRRRGSRPRSLSAVNGWLEPGQWRRLRRRLHGGRRSRRVRRHTLQGASGDRPVPPATLRQVA